MPSSRSREHRQNHDDHLQLNTSLHGAQAQSTRLASQDEEARAAALTEAGMRTEQLAA